MAVTLINAFEVPPEADDAFIAGWERARDFLAARDAYEATALHRALRADVDFRFVNVALVESQEAWTAAVSDPGFPGAKLPFRGHLGLYDVMREDGTPDVEGGAVRINPFELAADQDERFLAGWDRVRAVLAQKRGYLGTRLHRSVGRADFRFVDITRWSSPLMFARAREEPDYLQAAQALPFASHPALYQVTRRT
jgi:heme-degrading monooxygenase HmoA